jgi:DNA-binding NarL/FixJ family response regulator
LSNDGGLSNDAGLSNSGEESNYAEDARRAVRTTMRVLIIEEQEVIRRGLLALLAPIPEVAVSRAMGVRDHDRRIAAQFDVTLISTSALVLAEQAHIAVEHLRPVLVIVPAPEPHLFEIATREPADGYLMQAELTSHSLRTALVRVLDGQLVVPEAVAAHLLGRARGTGSVLLPQLYHLNSRGAEVLALLVAGASNKEIAGQLGISIHGVKRHVSVLLSQFHSPNRVHLVSHLLRSGVLSSGELRGVLPAAAAAAAARGATRGRQA